MFPIRDTIPTKRFPIMNWLIIVANVAIFVYELSLNDQQLSDFIGTYGLIPAKFSLFSHHDLWSAKLLSLSPFFTNMFLHSGWLHIILNMWVLIIFGDNVENRMGSFKYLAFYIICGIAASISHYFLNITSSIPAIGASGAIAGVMGAYMFLFPFAKVVVLIPILFIPLFFELPSFIYIGIWFIMQLWSGALSLGVRSAGIAFWAHIGGFLAGIILYKFFLIKKYSIS